MANPTHVTAAFELPKDVLTFVLGQTHYGVDAMRVQDVHAVPSPMKIAGDLTSGSLSIAGSTLPVLDRRTNVSSESCSNGELVKVLVLKGADCTFALAVDQVADLVRLLPTWIEPANDEHCAMGTCYVVEVADQAPKLSVVCVDRLLDRAKRSGSIQSAAG